MFAVPFLPAIIEILFKKDAQALNINMSLYKNPRYFGDSFFEIIHKGLQDAEGTDKILSLSKKKYRVKLSSSPEEVFILDSDEINNLPDKFDNIVICSENLTINRKKFFSKEIFVNGNLKTEEECFIRAIYINGFANLANRINILRWLHTNNNLYINADANVGVNCYCEETTFVNAKVNFKKIYAKKILIHKQDESIDKKKSYNLDSVVNFNNLKINKSIIIANDNVVIDGNIISDKAITIDGDFWIKGDIFSQEQIILKNGVVVGEENKIKSVVIDGNIISDKAITIDGDFWIKGDIFSQEQIILKNGVVVGEENKIKSVVGRENIYLGKNVVIYGYVSTEKSGLIDDNI
jgi:cytoskeletal protein CcmA (bactofilin family)